MKKLIFLAIVVLAGCTYVVDTTPAYCTGGQATLTDCATAKGCIVTIHQCTNNTY